MTRPEQQTAPGGDRRGSGPAGQQDYSHSTDSLRHRTDPTHWPPSWDELAAMTDAQADPPAPEDVAAAVRAATLDQLVRAWDEACFYGNRPPGMFRCPRCGAVGAEVYADGWRWRCPSAVCAVVASNMAGVGTKWSLRAFVLDDAAACLRLVQIVATDERRRAA